MNRLYIQYRDGDHIITTVGDVGRDVEWQDGDGAIALDDDGNVFALEPEYTQKKHFSFRIRTVTLGDHIQPSRELLARLSDALERGKEDYVSDSDRVREAAYLDALLKAQQRVQQFLLSQ